MKKSTADASQKFLASCNGTYEVLEFPQGTRTAADAAAAIGCGVAQIAKSIVFRSAADERHILVVTSGINRVDERKVESQTGLKIRKADADFVRRKTGYAIGGVPPFGHAEPPITLLDEDLQKFDQIWAAGGTPSSVFALAPSDLLIRTASRFTDIKATDDTSKV